MTDSKGNIIHNSLNSIILDGIVLNVKDEDDTEGTVTFSIKFYRYYDGVKRYYTQPCIVVGKMAQQLLAERQETKRNLNVRVVGWLTAYGMGSLRIYAEHIEFRPRQITTF